MIDVYCDGSYRQGENIGYVGIHIPSMGLGFTEEVKVQGSSGAERAAVDTALRICIDLDIRKATIYTDFLSLVKGAKKKSRVKRYGHLRKLQQEGRFKFRYVNRTKNWYAHKLSRVLLPPPSTNGKPLHKSKWHKWWRSTIRLFNPKS